MALSDIRTRIKNQVAAVASIGNVYDYERWASHEKDFEDLFKTGSLIKAWTVGVDGWNDEIGGDQVWRVVYTFTLRGYHSTADASGTQKTFDNLIESIRGQFRTDLDLGGNVKGVTSIRRRAVEPFRMLANVLCHYAEIEIVCFVFEAAV